MRVSALDHPLWPLEIGISIISAPLLIGVLYFQQSAALLGVAVLCAIGGVLLGIGITLLAARYAVREASQPAPVALLDDVLEGEYRVID